MNDSIVSSTIAINSEKSLKPIDKKYKITEDNNDSINRQSFSEVAQTTHHMEHKMEKRIK